MNESDPQRKSHFSRRYWPRQVAYALVVMAVVITAGGVALQMLTQGNFSLSESIYFALITVSTVGFAEPPELEQYPGTHGVIAALIVAGIGAVAVFESTITAMFIEGTLSKAFRNKRMEKKLARVKNHIVVAGCGRTGRFCVQELAALEHPFVIIDRDEEMLEKLNHDYYQGKLIYVVGDATEDQAMAKAGVSKASGLIAALTADRDNVFVVLSARTINPQLRIVAKALDAQNETKLRKAGADKLVSPHRIGGFRLVSELVRPTTMAFLDGMQAMSETDLHMEEVELTPNSPLLSDTLGTAPIRDATNCLVVAVRKPGGQFIHNPPNDHPLQAGAHLIVVGDTRGLKELRKLAKPH